MSQPDLPEKPTRTFSKRMTASCMAAAWATMWLSMWLGTAMAIIIVPLMVPVILGLSTAYQTIGHFDLRALATKALETIQRPEAAP